MGELRPTDVRLTEMAARLRLTYIRDHLVELVETAAKSHMSHERRWSTSSRKRWSSVTRTVCVWPR